MAKTFSKTEKAYQDSKSYTFRELEQAVAGYDIEYKKLIEENTELKLEIQKYDKLFSEAKSDDTK